MTIIVTRRSPAGDARWFVSSADEANDAIIGDIIQTAVDFPTSGLSADERRDAVRAYVALRNSFNPPFPKSESIGDTHYSVEEVISLTFPVELSPDDNGTFLATFPDVPGAVTFGDDEEQALVHAVDVLETMLLARILDRREIPAPSSANGRPTVRPTLLGTLKVMLYLAMRELGWRKADLARALDIDPRQADRLLDLRHASTVKHLEQALAVCGKRADVLMHSLKAA